MPINKPEEQDRSKGNGAKWQLLGRGENNSFYACVREQVPGKESDPYGSSQPRLSAGDGKAFVWRWGSEAELADPFESDVSPLIISMCRRRSFPQREGGSPRGPSALPKEKPRPRALAGTEIRAGGALLPQGWVKNSSWVRQFPGWRGTGEQPGGRFGPKPPKRVSRVQSSVTQPLHGMW